MYFKYRVFHNGPENLPQLIEVSQEKFQDRKPRDTALPFHFLDSAKSST